jgi:sensor domain CHASE-containing protein
MGYDRQLDYVFCVVERGGETVYSNLADPEAGTDQQDVEYFRPVLERLGLKGARGHVRRGKEGQR